MRRIIPLLLLAAACRQESVPAPAAMNRAAFEKEIADYCGLRYAVGDLLTCTRCVGTWSALGVIASHMAPHWSALSDSYFEIHADALSWVVMLAEVAAAAYLGLLGFRELRRPAGDSRRRPPAARGSAA